MTRSGPTTLDETSDSFGHRFWMLDIGAAGINHARNQDGIRGQIDLLPYFPLVGVAWIGGFKGERARAYLDHHVDEVLELAVAMVGARVVPSTDGHGSDRWECPQSHD